MNIIDCTPPANMPPIVLVQSKDGFWLRIETETGVGTRTLVNSVTLPGARREAQALGFDPIAWVDDLGIILRF